LPRIVLDQAVADGNIVPGTIIDIAQSSIGIGVRKEGPKPDISSAEKFKQVLLAAKTIVVGDPASGGVAGVHVADVFRRLGIMDQLAPKLELTRGQRNAEFVAKGEADIAVQLSNEIRIVPGIEFIPFPPEFGRTFVFSAGLGSNAKDANAAKTMLQFLAGPETAAVVEARVWIELWPSRDHCEACPLGGRYKPAGSMSQLGYSRRFVPVASVSAEGQLSDLLDPGQLVRVPRSNILHASANGVEL
jgi:hypothetical protein